MYRGVKAAGSRAHASSCRLTCVVLQLVDEGRQVVLSRVQLVGGVQPEGGPAALQPRRLA